jgi:hypothetical protein
MDDFLTYVLSLCAIFSTLMLFAIAIQLEKIAKKK